MDVLFDIPEPDPMVICNKHQSTEILAKCSSCIKESEDDLDLLRKTLIHIVGYIGGGCADNVSNKFLSYVSQEVLSVITNLKEEIKVLRKENKALKETK